MTEQTAPAATAGQGAQAIVIVHGIGDQRPMDTLRSFARAVIDDGRPLYAVPDLTDASYELHTLVAPATSTAPRTDLYEGYWAPEATGTTIAHISTWLRRLLLRRPSRLPARIRGVAARVALALVLLLASVAWVGPDIAAWLGGGAVPGVASLGKVLVALLAAAMTAWLTDGLGDAARYLDVRPANVVLRQAIRTRLVRVLQDLHECGRYDRIVLVGHSLGGVIAYDALRLLWRERMGAPGLVVSPAVDDRAVAAAARALTTAVAAGADTPRVVGAFQAAQQRCFHELAATDPGRWLVTDLITLGSPVAHATWLLADGGDDLALRVRERELPTCPPQPADRGVDGYRYPTPDGPKLHHGAPFALTCWTNLWFPGDPVGGPVRPTGDVDSGALDRDAGLGAGVRDVALPGPRGVLRGLVSHTTYWSDRAARVALDAALALDPDERSQPHH